MTRDEYISIRGDNPIEFITKYCLLNGKDFTTTSIFISLAIEQGILNYLYNYCIETYDSEFKIVLLSDKNGKLIKIY